MGGSQVENPPKTFFGFDLLVKLFGSDRSSRNSNLHPSILSSVRPSVHLSGLSCLEQSIFIILTQVFKPSVRNKSPVTSQRALSEHSVSTQRALREHSESTQRAIRE